MKRDTYTDVPSEFTETCRGFLPTAEAGERRATGRVQLEQRAAGLERHVGESARGRECDAEGLRRERQRQRLRNAHRGRVDHADGRRVFVGHPHGAVRRHRQRARARSRPEFPRASRCSRRRTPRPSCCPGSPPRGGRHALRSNTMLLDRVGRFGVSGRWTICVDRLGLRRAALARPPSRSRSRCPGCAKVCVMVGELENSVAGVLSSKNQLYTTFEPLWVGGRVGHRHSRNLRRRGRQRIERERLAEGDRPGETCTLVVTVPSKTLSATV